MATLTQRELAPSTAASLAWLCAVGPSDPEDASRLIPIVENILSTLPPESGSQRYALLNTLGALHLRAESPEQAIQRLEEGLAIVDGNGDLTDWTFLALAHHQMGQESEAQAWFKKATKLHLQKTADIWQRLEYEVLLRETRASLMAEPAEGADR